MSCSEACLWSNEYPRVKHTVDIEDWIWLFNCPLIRILRLSVNIAATFSAGWQSCPSMPQVRRQSECWWAGNSTDSLKQKWQGSWCLPVIRHLLVADYDGIWQRFIKALSWQGPLTHEARLWANSLNREVAFPSIDCWFNMTALNQPKHQPLCCVPGWAEEQCCQ